MYEVCDVGHDAGGEGLLAELVHYDVQNSVLDLSEHVADCKL
jgi:hypothetical protein